MDGFERKNRLLSLCGLNCGLCTMFLGKYCGGCGNGNGSCCIAKCSLAHHKVEYCFECECYPCENYQGIDDIDSFITHRHQKSDLEKAKRIGIDRYNAEQREKIMILNTLLSDYNDGRKKTFFCVAVNLLDLMDLRFIMKKLYDSVGINDLPIKERSSYAARAFLDVAEKRQIKLKLNRKK